MENNLRIILGGDVMLGRLVKEQIIRNGSDYPLGKIADFMRSADLTIVNLECAITESEYLWSGAPKAFYFCAPPQAADSLANAGVDLVSLANNHTLDCDFKGLQDTLRYLTKKQIKYAGTGNNIKEALTPAIIESKGIKFGMVAFCDHQEDFAATENDPGIAFIDLENETVALQQFAQSLEKMQQIKIDYPIISLHWGPNMVNRPSDKFIRIAHAIIDMGYKMLFGHSAHVFQGIEIYNGCPIFYATGDLVDDYYVDPEFKNDHQLLFELEFSNQSLKRIFLYPVFIEFCRVRFAQGTEFETIANRAINLCEEIGTHINIFDQHKLVIEIY